MHAHRLLPARRLLRRALALIAVAGCIFVPASAGADDSECTISWDGGAGTLNWDDLDNWSPNREPIAVDHVCIPADPSSTFGGIVIHRSGSTLVDTVVSQRLFALRGGTFEATGGSSFTDLELDDGRLELADAFVGTMHWFGGTQAGPGTTTVGGDLRLGRAGAKALDGRRLEVRGTTADIGGGLALKSAIELSHGAVLANAGRLELGRTDGLTLDVAAGPGGGRLENLESAIVAVGTNQSATVDVAFDNAGTVGLEGGSTLVDAADLELRGGGTDAGAFKVGKHARLGFNGGTHTLTATSSVVAPGNTLGRDAAEGVLLAADLVTVRGEWDVARTMLHHGAAAFESSPRIGRLELRAANNPPDESRVGFEAPTSIDIVDQRSGLLAGPASLTIGTYDWYGGEHAVGPGTTTVTGLLLVGGSAFASPPALSHRTLVSTRLARIGTESLTLEGESTLTNRGTLELGTVGIDRGPGGGRVANRPGGIVRAGDGGPPVTVPVETPFDNSGVVELGTDTLALKGGGFHSGAFRLGAGAGLELGGALQAFDETSSVTGGRTVSLDADAVGVDGAWDTGAVRLSAGTATFGASPRMQEVEVAGGRLRVGDRAVVRTGAYEQSAGVTDLGDGGRIELADPAADRVDLLGGILTGSGSVAANLRNAAAVEPGSGLGTLAVEGDYRQTAAGTLRIEAQHSALGGRADQLRVTGEAALAGTLTVTAPPGFTPPAAGLEIVAAAARRGHFDTFTPEPNYDVEYPAAGAVLVPAESCAGGAGLAAPRAPAPLLTDVLNLSRSASRAILPRVARVEDGMGVVWLQEGPLGGIRFRKVRDDGRTDAARIVSGGAGEGVFQRWDVAASGRHVYVVWEEATRDAGADHAATEVWLAASADGGATFSAPVRVSATPGETSWFPRVAASGPHVSVVWVDGGVLEQAVSVDGGSTFPLGRRATLSAHVLPGAYDVAQSGASSYVAFVTSEALAGGGSQRVGPVELARSPDGGATHVTAPMPSTSAASGDVRVAASGDRVHVLWADVTETHESDARRTAVADEWIAGSADRGATFQATRLTDAADRVHDYLSTHAIAADGDEVAVAWAGEPRFGADRQVFVRHSEDGGASFGSATDLGPDPAGVAPQLAAGARHVYVSWFGWPVAGGAPQAAEVLLAASADGGRSFALTGGGAFRLPAGCGETDSVAPALASSGESFGVAWMSADRATGRTRLEIGYRGGRLGRRDLELLGVEAVQAPYGVDKLVAGKPTVIRARVRSGFPAPVNVPVRVRYTDAGGTHTVEDSVPVAPGDHDVFLPSGDPIQPPAGGLDFTLTLDPGDVVVEDDESDNERGGHATVKDTKPLKVLVVPLHEPGEAEPSCASVHEVAHGTERYARSALPLDPLEVRFDPLCVPLELEPGELDSAALAAVFLRLERATWGTDYDKAIGVVRQGWFADHTAAFKTSVALAPTDSLFDAALVEAQNTGGWATAHEMAHQMGWVTQGAPGANGRHQDDVPAPGYSVADRMALARIDLMHHAVAGADVGSPVGRWIAPNTWDYLLSKFATDPADPPVIAISGVLGGGDRVDADPWYELDGVVDAPLGSSGEIGVRLLDAAGGVLGTAGFDATHRLAEDDEAGPLEAAPFTVRVPDLPGTARIQLVRGGDVVYERARSAAAPTVDVTSPAAGASYAPGDEIAVTWSSADADGDALTHLVQLSTDGGIHWTQVADAVAGSSIRFGAPQVDTDQALARVIASDGLNTTIGVSGRFSIRGARNGRIAIQRGDPPRIVTVDPDGGPEQPVAPQPGGCARVQSPDWSPDGTKIAFYGSGGCDDGLWVMDADGSGAHVIAGGAPAPPEWAADPPDWSPGGRRIAYAVETNLGGDAGRVGLIAVADADGSHPVTLAASGRTGSCPDAHPSWAPDGRTIAFDRGWCESAGIWVMNADGSGRRMLFDEPGPHVAPAFSPDGSRIALVDQNGLAVVGADGRGLRTLLPHCCWEDDDDPTPTPGEGHLLEAHRPVWSPDGTRIAFIRRTLAGRLSLFTITPEGTGRTRLTSSGDEPGDYNPSWQAVTPPVAAPPLRVSAGGPYRAAEGEAIALEASASSPRGDAVAYAWDLDGDGRYDDATGRATQVTFADDGSATVAVRATDAGDDVATARATVDVTNASPRLGDVRAVPDPRGVARIAATVADSGAGDELSAEVDWGDGTGGQPAVLAREDRGAWRLLGTHDYGSAAPHHIVVRVDDGDGGADERALELPSPPPNRPPLADAQEAATTRDAPVAVPLAATDPDGDRVTLEIAGPPEHGTVALVPPGPAAASGLPTAIYTPAPGFAGQDRFTFTASDGLARSPAATVAVAVQDPSPRPPPYVPGPAPAAPATTAPTAPRQPGARPRSRSVPVTQLAALPSARRCVSRRRFRIRLRLRALHGARIARARVRVNGRLVAVRRGRRLTAPVDLRGLPRGRFTVRIDVVTVDGRRLHGTRRYRTCARRHHTGRRRKRP